MREQYDKILKTLHLKAGTKQEIYRVTREAFDMLRKEIIAFAGKLNHDVSSLDKSIKVSYKEKGDFEIHLKFGGDTLVFIMHTNIFNFPTEHFVHKTEYVQANEMRSYCGMILIYNFLSDSIKYNRVNDTGSLISRVFINKDGKFFAEGKKQFSFLFREFGKARIAPENLRSVIYTAVHQAIEFDLMVPPVDVVQEITLLEKFQETGSLPIKTGKRLGFALTNQKEDKSQHPSHSPQDKEE